MDYIIRWVEETLVRDYKVNIAAKFMYENIITRFGFPILIVSDQGKHFLN